MANNKSEQTDVEIVNVVETSFVAALFDDVNSAKKAYGLLKDLNREGLFKIDSAAYMEKTDRSKVKVHEYKDWRGGQGAKAGAAAGAVVGIIGSTILLPVAVGALIGGTLSKVHDTKFSDKDLGKLADALPPGTSALIAIVEDEYVEAVEVELTKEGGKKVHSGEIPRSTADAMSK